MECRGVEAKERIDTDHGGITGLCQKLRTDPVNGLPQSPDEVRHRRQVFGANEIPPAPSKSFFKLVWEAVQDITLIILLVCSVVSLGLALYAMYGPKGSDDGKFVYYYDLIFCVLHIYVFIFRCAR